jgi:hypothetical protein
MFVLGSKIEHKKAQNPSVNKFYGNKGLFSAKLGVLSV